MNKKRREQELKNKYFWLVLSILVVLPIIIIGLNSQLSLNTSAVQNIALIKAGGFIDISGQDVKGVDLIRVTFNSEVRGATLSLKQDESIPFEGTAFSKFRLTSEDETLMTKISRVEINFMINKEELDKTWIKEEEIKAYGSGKEWATKKMQIAKQAGYLYYQAIGEQAGEFVIGKKTEIRVVRAKQEAVTPVVETAPEALPPAIEEPKTEQPAEQLPLAGEASSQGEVKEGFFSKIGSFFKRVFG